MFVDLIAQLVVGFKQDIQAAVHKKKAIPTAVSVKWINIWKKFYVHVGDFDYLLCFSIAQLVTQLMNPI